MFLRSIITGTRVKVSRKKKSRNFFLYFRIRVGVNIFQPKQPFFIIYPKTQKINLATPHYDQCYTFEQQGRWINVRHLKRKDLHGGWRDDVIVYNYMYTSIYHGTQQTASRTRENVPAAEIYINKSIDLVLIRVCSRREIAWHVVQSNSNAWPYMQNEEAIGSMENDCDRSRAHHFLTTMHTVSESWTYVLRCKVGLCILFGCFFASHRGKEFDVFEESLHGVSNSSSLPFVSFARNVVGLLHVLPTTDHMQTHGLQSYEKSFTPIRLRLLTGAVVVADVNCYLA